MKTTNIISFGAVFFLAAFLDLVAQEATLIVPGTRVRVTASTFAADRVVGAVESLTADTLVLKTEERATLLAVPLASVTRLDVSQGRKSKAGTGAVIGFLTGAVTGGVLFEVFCREHDCTTGEMVGVAIFGGAALSGIGALIGAFIQVDRWEEVPLERVRVGISPHGSGFLVSAAVTF